MVKKVGELHFSGMSGSVVVGEGITFAIVTNKLGLIGVLG